MARLSRTVIPGMPHHVTQRGNRRQNTFFEMSDYLLYTALMAESCDRYGVEVWAYCLMPNHAHLIAVPRSPDALRKAVGEAHRRYTRQVNIRMGWQGYLWQGRFASFAMDERYTLAAARYVELNPVRAGLASSADAYPWSSARAHLLGRDDGLVRVGPLLTRVPEWATFLRQSTEADLSSELRRHETTGRPLGNEAFVQELERSLGRMLRPQKGGRPRLHADRDTLPAPGRGGANCWHG